MQVQKNTCKWEILGDLSAPRFLTQRCLGVREREQPQFVSQTFLFGQIVWKTQESRICGYVNWVWCYLVDGPLGTKIYTDHNLSSASPYQRWSVVNTCKGMSKPIIFLHQLVCCELPRYVPPLYIPMTFILFCVYKPARQISSFPKYHHVDTRWCPVISFIGLPNSPRTSSIYLP